MQYLDKGVRVNLIQDASNIKQRSYGANDFINKSDVLYFVSERAKVNHSLYNKTKIDSLLLLAFDDYSLSIDLIQSIRQEMTGVDSKIELANKSQEILEGALNCTYQLYELTHEERYLDIALEFSEKNKAILLLEKLNDNLAKGLSTIPDSMLNIETDLNLRILKLEKLNLENSNTGKSELIVSQLNDLYLEKEKLLFRLEREYPSYYNLKYDTQPLSIPELMSSLSINNSAALEYFVGNKYIFLFGITGDNIGFYKIDVDDRIVQDIEYLKMLVNKKAASNEAAKILDDFTDKSYYLYNKLVKTALHDLDSDISTLTIITDKYIGGFPFSILLESKSKEKSYSIEVQDYLLKDYAISYQYSLKHKLQLKQKSDIEYEYDFIGYAPEFKQPDAGTLRECTISELRSLKCNTQEVESIQSLFNSLLFVGEEATLYNFHNSSAKAKVLHLATHACLSTTSSSLNNIYFYNDDLSVLDLSVMELNSELAVLSACNSGVGEYIQGDGVQSLARSFLNAGCGSTLVSLWSVDDCATSDFMNIYYKYLKSGDQKDKALQRAKIEFISTSSNDKQQPFYWASFVAYGDMDSLNFDAGPNPYYAFIGILLAIILFWILGRKKT